MFIVYTGAWSKFIRSMSGEDRTASNVHCHTLFASARLHLHGYLHNQTFNVMNDGQLLGHMAKAKISHDASYLSIQMTAENMPWG